MRADFVLGNLYPLAWRPAFARKLGADRLVANDKRKTRLVRLANGVPGKATKWHRPNIRTFSANSIYRSSWPPNKRKAARHSCGVRMVIMENNNAPGMKTAKSQRKLDIDGPRRMIAVQEHQVIQCINNGKKVFGRIDNKLHVKPEFAQGIPRRRCQPCSRPRSVRSISVKHVHGR